MEKVALKIKLTIVELNIEETQTLAFTYTAFPHVAET